MKIISLFSGAGGLDLGLIQAGHTIVWANDSDVDCVKTYTQNIGRHIVLAPIEKIPSNEIPQAEIVVGGFPCQGYSQANLKKYKTDPRNNLYKEFLRIIRDKQPKYFLAENVRGILSADDGKAIKRIERSFSNAGYRVQKRLFNTADYGVPQSRYRVIIIGTRKDMPLSLDYSYPEPTHSACGSGKMKAWVSIGSALAHVPEPDSQHSLVNHICSNYKVTNRNFAGHRTTKSNKPSPTILARGNGKGGVCALQHPNNHRRMSVREQALIQTFPIDFEFIGKMNSCYRQVGNAVPVQFGKILGENFTTNNDQKWIAA